MHIKGLKTVKNVKNACQEEERKFGQIIHHISSEKIIYMKTDLEEKRRT